MLECPPKNRVLFVAPVAPNLPHLRWHDELASLSDIEGAHIDLVAGESATIGNVARKLAREKWDEIIFSGHGKKNQLIFSDGRSVSGEWIATQVKASAPEVVVVGACYSGSRDDGLTSIGEAIASVGVHSIVFDVKVDDIAGAVYSTEFIRAMVASFDVARANRVASEMAGQYDWDTARGARLMRAAINGWRQFNKRFDALECNLIDINERLARLEEHAQREAAR